MVLDLVYYNNSCYAALNSLLYTFAHIVHLCVFLFNFSTASVAIYK